MKLQHCHIPSKFIVTRWKNKLRRNFALNLDFHNLKKRLILGSMLKHAHPSITFMLEVTFDIEFGTIYVPKLYPCAVTSDVEVGTIRVPKLYLWVEGALQLFLVLTDHCNLEYIWVAKWPYYFPNLIIPHLTNQGLRIVRLMFYHPSMQKNSPNVKLPSLFWHHAYCPYYQECWQGKYARHRETDPNSSKSIWERCMSYNEQLLVWVQMAVMIGPQDISATGTTQLVAYSMSHCAALVLQSSYLIPFTVASSYHYLSCSTHTFNLLLWCCVRPSILHWVHNCGTSSKSCKLVWLRSLPIAFQVDMVLFEQEFHHYSIQQDIITKSTVKCTAGSTPINTPVLNLIASQTDLHREENPVCQPFEGAVDRGSSSFPVLSKLSPKSFVESKQ